MKSTLTSLLILSAGAPLSQAAVLINEVDLANNTVELINTGNAVDMSSWWWCNRVNGSSQGGTGNFYDLVTSVSTINSGLSSAGATLSNFGAGQTLVLSLAVNYLPDTLGELGLYTTNSFASSGAVEDYLLWGSTTGQRDDEAAGAGLWVENQSIDISGIGAGQTLQAIPGTEGNGPSEWLIGASTIGAANIPEPASGLLALLGLSFLARRKRG